ncbi:hypothetical protein DW748_11970 [Ruminococcus sp. AM28-41]|nr:hypothetical protein DXA17_18470 [Ruminococcus sp. AM58-7XD]RHP57109.1 hypothetical protein DWZ27_08865 [Ruminococcus sp. AF31-16BH]RHQ93731.1 hypothetical protein DWX80_15035 [Ruminococcus sp. AF21-3]RHT62564.1 hypothetical protein DW748_11970 [Ruminococcus sp. AM28-41]
MTKIKNTKKGMAKKTLSMSLVVAMLATSNVPVWAAEFSDGTDVAVATEAPAEFADETEAPVVEDATETAPASTIINEGNMSLDLTASKSSIVWDDASKVEITGSVNKDGSAAASWKYRWVNSDGIVEKDNSGKELAGNATKVADMNLTATSSLAGKTLTLYVYDLSVDNQTLYDINTGITVTVEKQDLKDVASFDGIGTLTYKGFSQSVDTSKVILKKGAATIDASNYALTSTSATAAYAEVTVTASADKVAGSPYKGSISKTITIDPKTYASGDIVADVTKGTSYQYTGKTIYLPKDKITVKESKSGNNGDDGKLGGADLSGAFKSATVDGSKVGNNAVSVTLDGSKLSNFKSFDGKTLTTTNTVEITKRDLSTSGTKITVNTASGYVPVTATPATLDNYLSFTAVEGGSLDLKGNYVVIVKKADGSAVGENDVLTNGSTYTVTVRAKDDSKCKNEQTFNVIATSATLKSVTADKTYETSYTGNAIQPSKSDLGKLSITYIGTDGATKTELLDSAAYEITGYSNNTDATTQYGSNNGKLVPVPTAYANIKITSGTYKDQTAAIPFTIKPLEVKTTYVSVPKDISINKANKTAADYKVGLTVVAKDESGKKVEKTLTANDYTVDYAWKTPTDGNVVGNEIVPTVTITNKNYILNTVDGKTVTLKNFANNTKIVARKLTDAMVVVSPSSYTYTGGKITPTYSVVDGSIVLYKKGELKDDSKAEYEEVSITDAVNVGTGKITVKGLYNENTKTGYAGTANGTFTITAANTADVKVSIDDQDYTGKQVRPRTFKATLNGNDVTDQFEIVSYGENKEAGKGTVVLKPVDGNKNFTGSNITAEFNIVKEKVTGHFDIYNNQGFKIDPASYEFNYNGNAHTYAKTVLTIDTKKTTAKVSDFEIKYVDNISGKKSSEKGINYGYVYAVAKDGVGFSGDGSNDIVTADGTVIKGVVAKALVRIKSVEFVDKNVSLKNATYAGGLPVKPEVLIQIGGSTLVEGKDYTIKLTKDGKEVTPTDVTVGNIYGVEIVGINGYEDSKVVSSASNGLYWGVNKKNLNDCTVTVKDGIVTVLNGYLPVPATEYTAKNNNDGTYTVTAESKSKNYTGSKTVKADGKAEDEKPDAPMISSVKVVGNKATVILSGEAEGATGYDYVISKDRDCINNKNYASVNKNQVKTTTDFTYVQQGTYYAYCHAWKRGADGKKVFGDWSNAFPFVVSAITPAQPVITSVKASGSTVTVTYTKADNADGYDVVLGSAAKKVNGEYRPVEYGKLVKKNIKGNVVTATFKNVKKGTYYAGLHAFNRTSEDGKKVFSQWSNAKKVTVK